MTLFIFKTNCIALLYLWCTNIYFYFLHYRERILGDSHPDLLQSILYRGGVYADSHNYTSCLKLWSHAMKINKNNKFSVHDDLQRFTQVHIMVINH